MLAVVESDELADLRLRGDWAPSQLSASERLRYILCQRQMWLHFQNVSTPWKLGVLGNDIREGYREIICDDLVGNRAKPEWWQASRSHALFRGFELLMGSCAQPAP
jgi:hypothetical protein